MQYCSTVILHYKSLFWLWNESILKCCRSCREETWQQSKLSSFGRKPRLLPSSPYYPSLCFSTAWALWKSSSGNALENPTFLARRWRELVVNFSSWLTWEGLRLARILRPAPGTSWALCRLIWKGNWFFFLHTATQSLVDAPCAAVWSDMVEGDGGKYFTYAPLKQQLAAMRRRSIAEATWWKSSRAPTRTRGSNTCCMLPFVLCFAWTVWSLLLFFVICLFFLFFILSGLTECSNSSVSNSIHSGPKYNIKQSCQRWYL